MKAPSKTIEPVCYLEAWLPEELRSHVISYLDGEPSSLRNSPSHAPSVHLLEEEHTPLKNLALVSKGWNRLVKPFLFRCVSLKLGDQARPRETSAQTENPQLDGSESLICLDHWRRCLDLSRFLNFVNEHQLSSKIDCLTVSTEVVLNALRGACTSRLLDVPKRFWQSLFAMIDPIHIVIVAPSIIMADLLCLDIDIGDAWAFPGMAMKTVTLSRDTVASHSSITQPIFNSDQDSGTVSSRNGVLKRHDWSRIGLYEGSYLKAYGTYEYFLYDSPSILAGLLLRYDKLASFHYVVLFPFNLHLHNKRVAMSCKEVYFQFTPQPGDRTLDDPANIGKADLGDCWSETEQLYYNVVNPDAPSRCLYWPCRMEKFSTGDYHIASIRKILDEGFEIHAHIGWQCVGHGTWELTPQAREWREVYQADPEFR